jgi:cytidine deaminase
MLTSMDMRLPTDDDRELISAATRTIDAHADEDGIHTVGAAVRDSGGRVHVGVNLYHFTGGPCAELVALGSARASGARELTTIVAVGDGERGVIAPCGRDRQVLADYHRDIRVLIPTSEWIRSVTVADLLPVAFDWAAQVQAATQAND